MADEIASVSQNVKETASAVIAMQSAVVVAEKKAADYVCGHVNKGFYALIRSQVSRDMAKLRSEVESYLMQLMQQKKALAEIKDRMQRDYALLAKRYIKLFSELNMNLKQRIFALDNPAVGIAVTEVAKLRNRSKYLAATAPVSQTESIAGSQAIVASYIKYRTLNVLESINGFLHEMDEQTDMTDRMLIHNEEHTETKTMYVPSIICECNRDKSEILNWEISLPDGGMDSLTGTAILNAVYSHLAHMKWEHRVVFDPRVKEEFKKCVYASSNSKRVKDLTMKLFLSANYQTI
jgi:hypothetical protein